MRRLWNANTHYHGLVLASLPPGASRPPLTYREMKALSERVLPGVHYRRHLFGRYSFVWRRP
jgi:hypothetical protein